MDGLRYAPSLRFNGIIDDLGGVPAHLQPVGSNLVVGSSLCCRLCPSLLPRPMQTFPTSCHCTSPLPLRASQIVHKVLGLQASLLLSNSHGPAPCHLNNVLHCPTPVLGRSYANTVSARPRCHVPIQHAFLTRLVVPRLGSCASGIVCRTKSMRNKQAKPACYASWVLRASEEPLVKLIPAVRPSHCLLSLKRMLRELRAYIPHNVGCGSLLGPAPPS